MMGMSEKDDAIRRLTASLDTAAHLRASAKASAGTSAARIELRNWQAGRFSRTHADLLASAEYGDAARFFLTDLYGPADVTNRDALMQRVAPILSRMMSASALDVVADAIELDALSESLDADMVQALGEKGDLIDASAYVRAYRQIARQHDRSRQIVMIGHLGASLDTLSRQRLLGSALAMMRKPMEIAGFGDLHAFLERGFGSFRKMKSAKPFLDAVISREKAISVALFAGDDSPLVR
jgi:hypothetical protein